MINKLTHLLLKLKIFRQNPTILLKIAMLCMGLLLIPDLSKGCEPREDHLAPLRLAGHFYENENYIKVIEELKTQGFPDRLNLDDTNVTEENHALIMGSLELYIDSCLELQRPLEGADWGMKFFNFCLSKPTYPASLSPGIAKILNITSDCLQETLKIHDNNHSGCELLIKTMIDQVNIQHFLIGILENIQQRCSNVDDLLNNKIFEHRVLKLCNLQNLFCNYPNSIPPQILGQLIITAQNTIPELDKCTGGPTELTTAVTEIIRTLSDNSSHRSTKLLGPKAKLLLQQNKWQKQKEQIEIFKTTPINYTERTKILHHQIVTMDQISVSDYKRIGDDQRYISQQNDVKNCVLHLENLIAQHLHCDISAEGSLIKIYKEFTRIMQFQKPFVELSLLCDYFINAQDFEACYKRIQAFEIVLGSLSKNLKEKQALALYMIGDPRLWVQLIEEEKDRKAKTKEKREKIRSQKVRAAIEKQKASSRTTTTTTTTTPHKPAAKNAVQQDSDREICITNVANAETPKMEALRNAKEKKLREDEKQAAKQTKKNNIPQATAKEQKDSAPVVDNAALSRHQPSFNIKPHVYKLYLELYSNQPKLTNQDVMKLLAGFGLRIDSKGGKGSHTKCSFTSDEVVVDDQGNTIFTLPDLQSFMQIVPKWNSDNIKPYMVGTLRYILEKLGVTKDNIGRGSK